MNWKKYRRTNVTEMAPWTPDVDFGTVSVSEVDVSNGSPKVGDMVARNPRNHSDKWLVVAEYFSDNFEVLYEGFDWKKRYADMVNRIQAICLEVWDMNTKIVSPEQMVQVLVNKIKYFRDEVERLERELGKAQAAHPTWEMLKDFLTSKYCWITDADGNKLPEAVICGELKTYIQKSLPELPEQPVPGLIERIASLDSEMNGLKRKLETLYTELLYSSGSAQPVQEECVWMREDETDDDCEIWSTSCKHSFMLMDGSTPQGCNFVYCPFCRKPISNITTNQEEMRK